MTTTIQTDNTTMQRPYPMDQYTPPNGQSVWFQFDDGTRAYGLLHGGYVWEYGEMVNKGTPHTFSFGDDEHAEMLYNLQQVAGLLRGLTVALEGLAQLWFKGEG